MLLCPLIPGVTVPLTPGVTVPSRCEDHSALPPSLPGQWSSPVCSDSVQSLFWVFLGFFGRFGGIGSDLLLPLAPWRSCSPQQYFPGAVSPGHTSLHALSVTTSRLCSGSVPRPGAAAGWADEDNCPAISPALESLSFLVLSDNGIVCLEGRQGKFIFIKCCFNISLSCTQTFHQSPFLWGALLPLPCCWGCSHLLQLLLLK